MNFNETIITWYLANKRDLPWRKTTDPYTIWLSEIILQQTRVIQGIPYFDAIIQQFPKVSDLASADQELVLKLWQGLGYYSRARNLHDTAKYITNELSGKFPDNYNDLLKLKGVGEYTAAAIASFAFSERVAVVDGNVFRVLARIYGIYDDINIPKTRKKFQELANSLLNENLNTNPGLFNQAIMDFGAIACTPKKPLCKSCPFSEVCLAYNSKQIDELPVKISKTKIIKRYIDYILINGSDNTYLIHKRIGKGIWEGLYEFDMIESSDSINIEDVEKIINKQFKNYNIKELYTFDPNYIIHKLSHQHLHIRFWALKSNKKLYSSSKENLKVYAYPIVIANFIEKNYDKI